MLIYAGPELGQLIRPGVCHAPGYHRRSRCLQTRKLGDGLGYELIRNDGKSIFVRGDKAKQFERDWTYLKACYPFGPTRLILQKLWEIYA